MKIKKLIGVMSLAGLAVPGIAFATNGYFSDGFGVKSSGMAGVGIALPQDALAAATNPAGMVLVGDRVDFGLTWFRPVRQAQKIGGASFDGNDTSNFFIPEFGYNKMLNPNMSVGVSVFGNGGMNTDYKTNPGFSAPNDSAGVDLAQLFIAPTFAMKINPDNAIGISLNLAYQQFAAKGLAGFSPMSSAPSNLTNQGHDSSTGWGVRIGWTGQVTPDVTLGATYQSKTKMGKFSDYQGLFAEQGGFDIPANYGVGIAVKVTPETTVAADIQTIEYSDVKSIANLNNAYTGGLLGNNNGPGFGWRDMTVFKLGVSHTYSQNLTLRAGVSTGRQPIPSDQTTFNVLAPAVVETHLTLGATWTLANKAELSVGYMHAFNKEVDGNGTPTGGYNLKMHEDALGIAYGWKI